MRKIFLRNILKNKTLILVAFCFVLLLTSIANHLRNNYSDNDISASSSQQKQQPPTPPPPAKILQLTKPIAKQAPQLPKQDPDPTPPPPQKRNYLHRHPFLLECATDYNRWSPDQPKEAVSNSVDYSKPSPSDTHSRRLLRAILIYFPIESLEHFTLEFKWLYRSWIEMQKHEPTLWRTDLIVFVENDKKVFADANLFFNKLNCEFANLRLSPEDKPMCTLVDFKPLQKRDIQSKFKSYESLLDEVDIFANEDKGLEQFYALMKSNLVNYGYLNSILMAFEGYSYFKVS